MNYIPTLREQAGREAVFAAYESMSQADRDKLDSLAMQLIEAVRARNGGVPRGFGHMSAIELLGKLAMYSVRNRDPWLFPEISAVKRKIEKTPPNYKPPMIYKR